MSIENLIRAVPPPTEPAYAFDGPWEAIEARIRTPLPQDYKDLMRIYGAGQYMAFFGIYEPSSPGPWGRFIPAVFQVQNLFAENYPFPMYPQPGGLLPCGQTDNGDYLFWLARGPVSEWPIVVWNRGGLEGQDLETFECDLTDFLAGVVTGKIRPRAFPDLSLGEDEPAFRPTPDPGPEATPA